MIMTIIIFSWLYTHYWFWLFVVNDLVLFSLMLGYKMKGKWLL